MTSDITELCKHMKNLTIEENIREILKRFLPMHTEPKKNKKNRLNINQNSPKSS